MKFLANKAFSILAPIGQCRLNHIPSKGKRSKKRKRIDAKLGGQAPGTEVTKASLPDFSSSVVVGLSSITRRLESISQLSKPGSAHGLSKDGDIQSPESDKEIAKDATMLTSGHRPFSAVFVLSAVLPTILQEHLPQLIATASLAYSNLPATRLVQLQTGCESQLCKALGLQRVSFIGILHGTAQFQPLVDLLKDNVPEVQIPWLQEAQQSAYLSVKIKEIDSFGWIASK